jgi:hypothetical protein
LIDRPTRGLAADSGIASSASRKAEMGGLSRQISSARWVGESSRISDHMSWDFTDSAAACRLRWGILTP